MIPGIGHQVARRRIQDQSEADQESAAVNGDDFFGLFVHVQQAQLMRSAISGSALRQLIIVQLYAYFADASHYFIINHCIVV
jgi:hypothetical protein